MASALGGAPCCVVGLSGWLSVLRCTALVRKAVRAHMYDSSPREKGPRMIARLHWRFQTACLAVCGGCLDGCRRIDADDGVLATGACCQPCFPPLICLCLSTTQTATDIDRTHRTASCTLLGRTQHPARPGQQITAVPSDWVSAARSPQQSQSRNRHTGGPRATRAMPDKGERQATLPPWSTKIVCDMPEATLATILVRGLRRDWLLEEKGGLEETLYVYC
ncbi:uncharacterized protein C8Q71DRAFT_782629 [Rhodofomes roseus]|uniref:Uncharacterized protein n=1 Tax=Rhodofomes roseus TaxID=34475 RepID=A0ABQ8K463_9APHY|nr:uncharacterized protein C8Q71DRAFT_782629 [Rhodofomes roseus]KAH9831456.1 hypothetical protein C8Q71DRAFT_782629 [Rhodofomes roseus]